MEQLSRALALAIIAFFVLNSAVSAQIQDYEVPTSQSGYLEPVYDPSALSGNGQMNSNNKGTARSSNAHSYNDYEAEKENSSQNNRARQLDNGVSNNKNNQGLNSSSSVKNSPSSTGILSHLLKVETNPDGSVHVKAPFLNINTASGKVDVKLPLVKLNVDQDSIKVKAPLVNVKTNGGAVDVKAPFVHVNH